MAPSDAEAQPAKPQREHNENDDEKNMQYAHLVVLEDLVKVNELFSVAVFLGLNLASPGQRPLYDKPACPPDITKRLVVTEIISFAWFLLSSVVAKALSIYLRVHAETETGFMMAIRIILLTLSVGGSLLGCAYLGVSMVDVIQLKLGMLACGVYPSWTTAGSLVAVVIVSCSIYVSFALHSIYRSVNEYEQKKAKKSPAAHGVQKLED